MPEFSFESFALLCAAGLAGLFADAASTLLLYRRPFQVSRTALQKRLTRLARRLDRERRPERVRFGRGVLLAGVALTLGIIAGLMLGWLTGGMTVGWLVTAVAVGWLVEHRAIFALGRAILYEMEHSGAIAAAALLRAVGTATTPEPHAIFRATIALCAQRFGRGVVAPVFAAAVGGLPLLLGWAALDRLLRGLETDEAGQGAVRRGAERLHMLAGWIPMRLAGLVCAATAALVPGCRPLHSLAAAFRGRMGEGALPAVAGALDVTLGRPGRWIGTGRAKLLPADLRRAMLLFLVGSAAYGALLAAAAVAAFAAAG